LELWKSNGTAAGTVMVQDLNAGPSGSNPGELTPVGSNLYFTASDGTNTGLWQFDGTSATFVQAGASNPLNASGTPALPAPDGANGPALWKRDGNTTALVKDLGQGTSAGLLTNVNGTLYLVVDGPGNTEALWKSNGSGANTGPVFAGSQPLSELTAVGS